MSPSLSRCSSCTSMPLLDPSMTGKKPVVFEEEGTCIDEHTCTVLAPSLDGEAEEAEVFVVLLDARSHFLGGFSGGEQLCVHDVHHDSAVFLNKAEVHRVAVAESHVA